MLAELAWLLIGLALIVKGGDFFVAAALRIAGFLKMPRVVIGSTLVSLATTSPELTVAIVAGIKGEPGLAIGNAVGSCICNIGLILGVTATLKHVDVHLRALRTPLTAMFGFGLLLFVMTLDLSLLRWQGVILVTAGMGYFAWDFWRHWRERKPEAVAEAHAIEKEVAAVRWPWFRTGAGTAVQFVASGFIIVIGSRWLVEGATHLAARLGIPSILIGLTIVALGTSLPELTTAVASSQKAVSDLAVGNVLGANIANLSLITGTAAILGTVRMDRLTQAFNFPAMLVIMGLLLRMLLTDRRVTRREGVVLLATYVAYITGVALLTAAAAGK